ncbi:MAG: DUF502 domain-containing protein [Dehalococcoidia bacterium]|nr:DUF502 domain-containing protein [Dehalococcoidia bacterium]
MTTPAKNTSARGGISAHFRGTLVAGLLLLVPVVITYVMLSLLFNTIDGILQPAVKPIVGRRIPGLGLVILVLLIYVVGLIGANFIGKSLVDRAQHTLLKIPIIRAVYKPAKLLVESLSGEGPTGFKRVVLIEYPRIGTWTMGFLTSTTKSETGAMLAIVYIPTAPTPQSGWVAIMPADQVYDTNLSVPEAMNLVLSGGIVSPARVAKKPLVL